MENQVTQLLKAMVKPDYTACSYAFMQDGKIVCADAIGVIDKINNQPITTIVHLMYVRYLNLLYRMCYAVSG